MKRQAAALETVSVIVPAASVPVFEAAFADACQAVGIFIADEAAGTWRVEGVRPQGEHAQLAAGLALAELASGFSPALIRQDTDADGWLARVYDGFPEQSIGRRFAVRGTHVAATPQPGRVTLMLDAGLAFGSGEHGSTRGCLRALEAVAHRKPRRIVDMGCGSGILAMGAARLLRRRVLAVDIDPWSVAVSRRNARLNGIAPRMACRLGNGWHGVERGAAFDLVFANILARPLCLMARELAAHLAPRGTAILAGLRDTHRRAGLRLELVLCEGHWRTLVMRK